jgi:hypothetical protein
MPRTRKQSSEAAVRDPRSLDVPGFGEGRGVLVERRDQARS